MQSRLSSARVPGRHDERLAAQPLRFRRRAALIAAPTVGLGVADGGRTYRRVTVALAAATIATGSAALRGLTGSRKGLWQRTFQLCSHSWQVLTAGRLFAEPGG